MPAAPKAKTDRTTVYLLAGLAAAVVVAVWFLHRRSAAVPETTAQAPSVRAGDLSAAQQPAGGASSIPGQLGSLITGGGSTGQNPGAVQNPTGTDGTGGPAPVDYGPPAGGGGGGSYDPGTGSPGPAAVESGPPAVYQPIPGAPGPVAVVSGPPAQWSPGGSPGMSVFATPAPVIPHPVGPLPGGPVVD